MTSEHGNAYGNDPRNPNYDYQLHDDFFNELCDEIISGVMDAKSFEDIRRVCENGLEQLDNMNE